MCAFQQLCLACSHQNRRFRLSNYPKNLRAEWGSGLRLLWVPFRWRITAIRLSLLKNHHSFHCEFIRFRFSKAAAFLSMFWPAGVPLHQQPTVTPSEVRDPAHSHLHTEQAAAPIGTRPQTGTLSLAPPTHLHTVEGSCSHWFDRVPELRSSPAPLICMQRKASGAQPQTRAVFF